jgi:uncharacterized membrane protein
MHPLLVHFPIALLFATPVFLVLALVLGRRRPAWPLAALILLLLGTLGVFFAAASGEAAGKVAERSPDINAVLERHEHLAEAAQGLFSGFALAFAALIFIPRALKRDLPAWGHYGAHGLFLAAFLGGLGLLVQIAHQGGRLVHQYGVHALMPAAQGEILPQTAVQEREDD